MRPALKQVGLAREEPAQLHFQNSIVRKLVSNNANYAFGAGAASSFGGAGTSFTAGAAAGAPQDGAQVAGAEQQLTFASQHFGAEAQQVGAGLQQLAVWVWHGAGAAAQQVGAGAWQQVVCLQHLTFGALQHLTFAGLQQSRASAAPLKAARTASVALNATNFRLRLMLFPFQL